MTTFVERVCASCSKDFRAALGEVNRGKGVYCSKHCVPIWNKGIKGMKPWMNLSGLKESGGGIGTRFKKGCSGFNTKHSEETKVKISMAQQKTENWIGFVTPDSKKERHRFAKAKYAMAKVRCR